MKKSFSKSQGRFTEKLEIEIEEKWIYVYYSHGDIEKTAYILKNNENTDEGYLHEFWQENNVSDELKAEIRGFLQTRHKTEKDNLMQFSTFLIKAISYNLVIGAILAMSIFGGFKLGSKADNMMSIYPVFTIIGVFLGIGFGAYCGYVIIKHYLIQKEEGEPEVSPLFSNSKKQTIASDTTVLEYSKVDVSLEEVRLAIRKFSDNLPEGTYRTILVKDDYSIDFSQLTQYLKGIPTKKFYMSKETYDVFDETGKAIPEIMDKVQKAVDLYLKEHGELPLLQYDPLRKINIYQLTQDGYLDTVPDFDFFLTDYDGIITNIKPKKEKKRG